MNKFIEQMMEIGVLEDRACSKTERYNAVKAAEELYDKHISELKLLGIADVSERLYSMELGERFELNHLDYFRAPGGWIVVLSHGSGSVTSTFVPFDNEFNIAYK